MTKKTKKVAAPQLLRKDVLKLIDNLTSGEYQKGKHKLVDAATGKNWCCLGVWADQHGCTWKKEKHSDGLFPVKGKIIGTEEGSLEGPLLFGLSMDDQSELISLNDNNETWKEVLHYVVDEMLPDAV